MKNKKFLSHILSAFLIMVFVLPLISSAQDGGPTNTGPGGITPPNNTVKMSIEIKNPFKANSISELIKTVVNDILMPIGAVIAVLMIMYAGFKYVTARGNTTKIGEAHNALLYAAIGTAVLLGAWVISNAIQKTVDQLKI